MLAEIDFRANHYAGMMAWPDNDPRVLTFRYEDLLVDFEDREGVKRFDFQYWRANIDPSERYVSSLKGTTQFRLKSGESGFSNLVLAGDWTDNTLCVGCVEAATISGLMASRAVCGYPEKIHGE